MRDLSSHKKSEKDSATSVKARCVLMVLSLLLCTFLSWAPNFASSEAPIKKEITVVMDNNYPPYSYINSEGVHVGIVVDQWKLFQEKTGIQVKLLPMQWSEAFGGMKDGKYDVIDTISFNKDRTAFLDYANPYATIDVPIYYAEQISGISDAKSLKGFSVGVKKGDLAIRKLEEQGITSVIEFPSSEALVKAAADKKIVVFVLGKPPAEFFLNKFNAQENFKYSGTLYTSQFFRAVQKGNDPLLKAINQGFDKISRQEYEAIDQKFMGYAIQSKGKDQVSTFLWMGLLAGFGVMFILWRWVMEQRAQKALKYLSAELELYKNKGLRQQLFFDAIPDLFFIFSLEGTIIDYQGPSKGDLYRSPDLFLNRNIRDVYPPDLVEKFTQALASLSEGQKSTDIRYWMMIENERHYFEARLVLEQDQVVVIVRNIDEPYRIQHESEERLWSLEQKTQELQRFIQVLVHDLHSPIIGIKAYADMVMKAVQEDHCDEIERDVKKIISSTSKADHIINELIEYLRINDFVAHRKLISMNRAAAEVVEQLEVVAREKQMTLQVSGQLPSAYGDPDLMGWLFKELVSNAIQHMEVATKGMIEIGHQLTANETVFYVKDNGVGVTKTALADLFGLFSKNSPESTGLGIGLATAKLIIEKHGGRIWAETPPEGGFKVLFTLPDQRSKESN